MCFLIINLPLNNTFARFLLQLHKRLITERKSFKILGGQAILQKYFNSHILPCVEYCSPVWSSAADSHLQLLDKNLNAIIFLIPGLSVHLWH